MDDATTPTATTEAQDLGARVRETAAAMRLLAAFLEADPVALAYDLAPDDRAELHAAAFALARASHRSEFGDDVELAVRVESRHDERRVEAATPEALGARMADVPYAQRDDVREVRWQVPLDQADHAVVVLAFDARRAANARRARLAEDVGARVAARIAARREVDAARVELERMRPELTADAARARELALRGLEVAYDAADAACAAAKDALAAHDAAAPGARR